MRLISNRYTRKPVRKQRKILRARLDSIKDEVRRGKRGLVSHWALIERRNDPSLTNIPAPTPRSLARFERFQAAKKRGGAPMFDGTVARVGFIPRQSREKGKSKKTKTVSIPLHTMRFFDYVRMMISPERDKWMKNKHSFRNPRSQEAYARAHHEFPFSIGFNSILEVGNDGTGNPTHILVLKRGPHVALDPNVYDFPAGMIRGAEHPFQAVRKRTAEELGVDPGALKHIGPGLKPTKKEYVFAMQRLDSFLNTNGIIIQRSRLTKETIEDIVRRKIASAEKTGDKFAPVGYFLIPRNSKAIVDFTRKHPTFMPEIFRLYAQELRKVTQQDGSK